ncbi:type IV secretory system conjugative DNA transfer family protein [uncultured Desulfobulbus sp.]|uniref:type IV secretory system conjugative DNA transfer family protein n=1 Tax=uncultured Desulfobulbus sp. TaxID=239745 RepID=UPI0029C86E46|nr:type IV secretory system conjugative DNA transfer family protein [uncultured Desulfobulbus sp.]
MNILNRYQVQNGISRFGQEIDIGIIDENSRPEDHCFIGREYDPRVYPRDLYVKADAHLVSIGATRSKKTVGTIIPNILWAPGSAFVLDSKGEIAWATAPYLRFIGKKVVIVDPFNEINKTYGQLVFIYEIIACYNPLADLNPSDPYYTAKLYDLFTGLIPCTDPRNDHWINGARDIAIGITDALIRSEHEEATLPGVMKVIHSGIEGIKSLANTVLDDPVTYPSTCLARMLLERYSTLNPAHDNREDRYFISTARNQLNFLNDPMIQESLSRSDFSFREFTDNTTELVVFFVLPPHLLEAYSGLTRMMISMAINAVSSNCNSLTNPVNFYLDEFGTVGSLPVVSRAFGLMGGRGIRLWIFIQTISQLKRDYHNDWQNFLGNSSAISVLKVFDLETAQLVSDMLGQGIKRYGSEQTGDYSNNDSHTFMRPLLAPEAILRLPADTGILITDTYPVYYRKVRSYADQPFCNVIRPNPLYR